MTIIPIPNRRSHFEWKRTVVPELGRALQTAELGADAEQLHQRLQLAEARLATQARLQRQVLITAGIAHDLGNLLTVILGQAEMLQEDLPSEIQDELLPIVRAAKEGQAMIRQALLDSEDTNIARVQSASITRVVEEALVLVRAVLRDAQSVALVTALPPTPPVQIEPLHLREVLINLVLNAVAAMTEGGTLTISSRATRHLVFIDVTDTGVGLAREVTSQLFQPFVSTRPDGSGLGLAVSRALIEQAGGSLTATSQPNQGTTITIALPIVDAAAH